MKKLTIYQFLAIQNLADNPLIQKVYIYFKDGKSEITIISKTDVDWDGFNGVDSLLVNALDKEFPNLEYKGKPFSNHNLLDGYDDEFYFLNFEGEHLINLVMKKTPVCSRSQKEISRCNNIMAHADLEEIIREQEG